MYVRFVVPHQCVDTGVEYGLFHGRDQNVDTPEWLTDQLNEEFRWFNKHLPIPERLWLEFKRRDVLYGVCWFRASAREAISHARYLGWLMTEAGTPVQEIYTYRPGTVFYRDDWQIVAEAGPHIPRAFY